MQKPAGAKPAGFLFGFFTLLVLLDVEPYINK